MWGHSRYKHLTMEKLSVQCSQERLNKRVQLALPVRVTWRDSENRSGLEMACTYDISSSGARLTGLRCAKREGEIIAIERGRNNKTFCRIVWIGEPESELRGQIGIECAEPGRNMWEMELSHVEEIYDPILRQNKTGNADGNRRRLPRFPLAGTAELSGVGPNSQLLQGGLKDLSETGCLVVSNHAPAPGTSVKVVLNVANYQLAMKGMVRHTTPNMGVGIEFYEIRKGDRQMLQFLMRKLTENQFEESFQFAAGQEPELLQSPQL